MAALVLSIAGSVVLGALVWLLVGPRLKLAEEQVQNEVLNVLSYIGIAFVILFPIVLFLLGELFLRNGS